VIGANQQIRATFPLLFLKPGQLRCSIFEWQFTFDTSQPSQPWRTLPFVNERGAGRLSSVDLFAEAKPLLED
jgi:hypothetical protein